LSAVTISGAVLVSLDGEASQRRQQHGRCASHLLPTADVFRKLP